MSAQLARLAARWAKIPPKVKAAVSDQLAKEAGKLADAIRHAAPVNDMDPHPGALRDSVRAYKNPRRDVGQVIVADAKDEKGHAYGQHVEFGHRTKGGKHVAAQPFFFATYRAKRRAIRRNVSAAAKKAFKAEGAV